MNKKTNRAVMAAAGLLVLLLAGMIYSWSVLSRSIGAEYPDWSKAQLSTVFTLLIVFFCTGIFICGFLINKVAPRVLILSGAVFLLVGFLLASRATSIVMLFLSFSLLCGMGSGLSYNGVMSTVTRWFPDKKGFISGLLLMGFGFSSFLVGKAFQAFTPETIGAWRGSFVVMGIITAAVIALGGIFIKPPKPEDLPEVAKPSQAGADTSANSGKKVDYTTGEMVRQFKFWLYYIWSVGISMAGLALIAQASGAASATVVTLSGGAIATMVGIISIANGGGRIVVGWMFDKVGSLTTMHVIEAFTLISAGLLVMALKAGSLPLLVAGFLFLGFAYGGAPVCNAAFVSSNFGLKNYAMNFSVINTCLIVASVGSTISGAIYDATMSYNAIYMFMAGLAILGALASIGITISDRK